MYEMEYVESSLGHYPSTEAFLQLLASLIAVGGFPSGLGQNWRARSGCAPYVEYVIDYILPRATGQFEQLPALPFRSTDDKSRLLARALEVVEIVLTRYVLPGTVSFPDLPAEKLTDLLFKSTQAAANHALGHVELGKITVVRPYTEDVKLMVDDFRSSPYQSLNEQADLHSTTQHISTAATSVVRSSIPRPKAPGFFVLAEMLSPVGYKLFSSVISPCVHQGINLSSKLSVDNFSMANALYIATPPTFLSAKEGALRAEPTNARKTLLKPLRPAPVPIDDVNFGERAILIALRILCATIAREDMFCQSVNAAKGQMSVVPVLRLQRKSLIPIAIDLQLSKLSRLLLSSEMVSSIINLIGFVSLNERIDADIASAATAIVFYIERSLARPQVAQLLSLADTHREGGRLAHAFNTRFLVASTRPLSQPDVQLLRFVFNRLLSELRTERSSGILTQVMFGFPKSNSDSSGLVRAEHADCLQSIVRLLGGNDFVFGASCGDVATSCYEILYRLTMIKSGDSEIRLALYTAERLRAIDFWKGHLIKIFSSMRAATHFATLANKYHVIHSISWLLKGAAGELHLLAGFSSGFVASAGFEGLAAPRPGQYKSLCQALFSDEGLVVHALRALPIERPQIDPMCSPPSDEQALIEAKEFLHGSPDIVQGYVTINFVTLVEWMRTKGLKVQEDGLRSWVDHWNHSVLRDCASAHLSDGIYYVLGSFVSSSNDAAFQIPTGIVAGTKMMIHILTCMTLKEDLNTSNQVLDGAFFTTACRNLALATRILASSVFSQGSDKTFPGESVETATVCSLMARAIACSAAGSQSPVSSRRNETTSILASALVPVLKALPDQRLRDEDHYFLFQAAMVLSVLSSDVDVKRIPAIQTPDTLVARACLSHLLETLENSSTEQGYCRALLTDTTKAGSTSALIQALIGLIPYLDENVATLLQMLVGLSHVADLLLAGGILEALQAAADKYQDEGARLLNSQAHNIHYGEAQIQTPAFLLGHFDLMGALLATPMSSDRRLDTATKIMSVVKSYNSVFARLLTSFPIGGDTLYAMLRCLAQLNSILRAKAINIDSRSLASQRLGAENFLGTTYLLSQVAKLTMHIAENPMPIRFLGVVPSRLNSSQVPSGLVVVSAISAKSWWDTQDTTSGPMSYELSGLVVLGMDILRYGFLLIRDSAAESSLDEFILSRALCRCTDAAMVSVYMDGWTDK